MSVNKDKIKQFIFDKPLDEICDVDTLKPKFALYPLHEYFETHTSNTIIFDDEAWYDANEWTKLTNEFIALRLRQEKLKRITNSETNM